MTQEENATGVEVEPGRAAPGAALGEQNDLLAAREAEVAELRKELLYQRAEFDNFRKRTERRYGDLLEFATEPLVRDLLPVLDDLERALAHARESGPEGFAALVNGLDHIAANFQGALARHGVESVLSEGERFDPNVHESVAFVEGEEANRVAAVYQKGFLLKGRLLRPARVAISRVATPSTGG